MSHGEVAGQSAPRGSSWMLLLPALLSYQAPVMAGFSFNLQYFLIPVAALLGARHGIAGVISVAVGGLAFVPGISGGGWGFIGGNPSLYLIGLALAAIAASRSDVLEWPQWPSSTVSIAALSVAAPLLLVLVVSAGFAQPSTGGARVAFNFGPVVLGYFVLFAMGMRGARLWPLLAGLAVLALLSWSLTYMRVFPSETSNLQLDMRVLQPVTALTALVFFSAGMTFRHGLRQPGPWGFWRWPYWSMALLLLIWLPLPIGWIRLDWGSRVGLSLMGSAALLPISAFMLGALRGTRGTWMVIGTTVALLAAGVIAREIRLGELAIYNVPLEAPFLAYAYGKLGAFAAGREATRAWRVPAWAKVGVLGLATASAIVGDGGKWNVALGIAFALLFAATFFIGWRIRKATTGTPDEITPEGWVSVTVLVCAIVLLALDVQNVLRDVGAQLLGVAAFCAALYGSLREAWQEGGASAVRGAGGDLLVYVAVAAVFLLVLVSALRKGWRDTRKAWKDVRIVWRYGKLVLTGRASAYQSVGR